MAHRLSVTTKPFPNIVSGIRPHACVFIIKKNIYNRTHGGLNKTKTGFQCMDKKKKKNCGRRIFEAIIARKRPGKKIIIVK